MSYFRQMTPLLCVAGLTCALSSGAALAAPSYELSMTAPVGGVTLNYLFNQASWLSSGDIATFTVRYGADNTPDTTLGAQAIYKNAINYFSVEISRGGAQTYFGEASGSFGQIGVFNDVHNTNYNTDYDQILIRFLDSASAYPSGTQTGTTPAPALSPAVTPAVTLTGLYAGSYGDMVLENFTLRFTTLTPTAWASTALPTSLNPGDLGPQPGSTPFSGYWDLTGDPFGPMSIGSGGPASMSFRVLGDTPPNSGGSGLTNNVPAPATLWLLALGLGAAGLSRRNIRSA